MKVALTLFASLAVGVAPAAQDNPIFTSNGAEVVRIFSDPSVGGSTPGSITTADDLYWTAYPEECGSTRDGFYELLGLDSLFIGDSDWTTPPRIHDIGFGPGMPVPGSGGSALASVVPDFFSTGTLSALLSLGPSGLPDPCSVVPTLCTTPGCPPPITGFVVDIAIGTGPGSGLLGVLDGATSAAMTVFLPGGMPFTGTSLGTCGLGDYEFTGAASTDENQADAVDNDGDTIPDGASLVAGFQVGGTTPTGPVPDDADTVGEVEVRIDENTIQTLTATPGFLLEHGLSNALFDVSSGSAVLAVEVHSVSGIGGLAVPAFSTGLVTPPGPPGFPAFGGFLLLNPASFLFTASLGFLTPGFVTGVDDDGDTLADEGVYTSNTVSIPAGAAGMDLFYQAFVITSFGPPNGTETMVCKIRIQ